MKILALLGFFYANWNCEVMYLLSGPKNVNVNSLNKINKCIQYTLCGLIPFIWNVFLGISRALNFIALKQLNKNAHSSD